MTGSQRSRAMLAAVFTAIILSLFAVLPASATEASGLVVRDFLMLPDGSYPDEPNDVRVISLEEGRMVGASGYVRDDITGYAFDRCEPDGIVAASEGGTEINIFYKANIHLVSYLYTGTTPPSAPPPPDACAVRFGATVEATEPTLPGYDFSGWVSLSVDIDDGAFTMPDENVSFTGYFTAQSHQVSYSFTGEPPVGAVPPKGGRYLTDETVTPADEPAPVTGYTFLGWEPHCAVDVSLDSHDFIMPPADIEFIGSYIHERYTLRVGYSGASPLPPAPAQTLHYGDTVELAPPAPVEGWVFLGYTSGDEAFSAEGFAMPPRDMSVTGKWLDISGWRAEGVDAIYDGAEHRLALHAPNLPAGCVVEVNTGGEWRGLDTGFIDVVDADALMRVSLDGIALATLPARISIRPRPLTLVMPSGESVFNGEEQTMPVELPSINEQAACAGLRHGDTVTGLTLSTWSEGRAQKACNQRTDAGEWEIAADSVLITREERDVTSNYRISLLPGYFTIRPIPAEVSIAPVLAVYTGGELAFDPEITVAGLSSDARRALYISYLYNGEVIASKDGLPRLSEAGVYKMTIMISSDDPNYEFDPSGYEAVLRIAPARILATAHADSAIFDGLPHGITGLTLTPDGDTIYLGGAQLQNPGLAAGQAVSSSDGDSYIYVGSYTGLYPRNITITDGERDVTANYAIRTAPATLEITKRPVYVQIGSAEKRYDGTPLSVSWRLKESDEGEGLVVGHELRGILSQGSRTLAGSNEVDVRAFGVYDWNGADVTANYTLSVTKGVITVTPRPIYVDLSAESRVYDGLALNVAQTVREGVEGEGLVIGDSLELELFGDGRVHVGENEVKLNAARVLSSSGEDVSASYNVICGTGSLSILPRPLRVIIGSSVKPYDGEPLRASWAADYRIDENNAGLAAGDAPYVSLDIPERTVVGRSEVRLTAFGATGADGSDSSGDYTVTATAGSIEITPATTYYTVRYIYDGEIDAWQTLKLIGGVGNVVSTYPPKPRAGMRLDYVSGLPLTLEADGDDNLLDVFYYTYRLQALPTPDGAYATSGGLQAE